MQETNLPEMKYATFTGRMLASVIDTLLSTIVLIPIFNLFNAVFKLQDSSGELQNSAQTTEEAITALQNTLPSFLFQTIVVAIVVIIFWIYRAATPGKMFLKMKIVDAKTGLQPSKTQLIVRYLGYFISTLTFGLGFVWIYYDKRNQGFHDKIAGTVVIKTEDKNI